MTDLPRVLRDPGALHVWIFDTRAAWYDALADSGVTSTAEEARADRLATAELGRRLRARRSALRFVLGRYLGCSARNVDVVVAPGGKPVLVPETSATPAFSIGHSGDLFGVALSAAPSVGFDVERVRSVPRADAIASRWFGDDEARMLEGLEGDGLEQAFIRLWTGKEALAKRHGAGLRLMMRGDVDELDTGAAEREGRLRWLEPVDGYYAAVASGVPIEDVTLVAPEDDAWI